MGSKSNDNDVTAADVARILAAVDASEIASAREIVMKMIKAGPHASAYRKIEQLAEDTEIATDVGSWELEVVTVEKDLEALLARNDWEEPAEVIDLDGRLGVDYRALLNLCRARLRRGEGSEKRLREVQAKLETSAKKEREVIRRKEEADLRLAEALSGLASLGNAEENLIRMRFFLRETLDVLDAMTPVPTTHRSRPT